ncbi:MAG: hypothetical protein FWD17_02010 [Polyangiaceae bacterium]|nr:hypothetical protein [Polyangiaceae bacterium]
MDAPSRSCCVCGESDARALVDVNLASGASATLCGSHALMHARARATAQSEADLRNALSDRRGRRDRRRDGDELGAALTAAFSGTRRTGERRA